MLDGQAVAAQHRPDALARGVEARLDLRRIEIDRTARGPLPEVDLVEHHALGEEPAEGFIEADQLHIAHHPRPEARVQQVQDRVFDATDVLIDRQPVLCASIHRHRVLVGTGEAQEVPRGIDEGVHRVGFAARALAATRAAAAQEGLRFLQRIARAIGHQVFGQSHRQVCVGHGHLTAGGAMDEWNRAAPVALPGDAPVTQAPLHPRCGEPTLLERAADRGHGRDGAEPGVLA